jgi:hypothetical protein
MFGDSDAYSNRAEPQAARHDETLGLPPIRKPFKLNEVRRQRRNDVAVSPLARIPDRFGQHGVKLALAEFLRVCPKSSGWIT